MEQKQESGVRASSEQGVDEIDRARAREYALLAILLSRSPNTEMIGRLASLTGDGTPLGAAHVALGDAAARTDETRAGREFFSLFTGLGAGELQPYASHYLTGSLYGRPLALLRDTLQRLGVERAAGHSEPEDHVAVLCEVMAGLIGGQISGSNGIDRAFFDEHLAPWIGRFFADLEQAKSADFYSRVGSLGRVFVAIETEAFALSA
ncbi:molecular chaperone TorD [Bradyrhizobium canariense]|uniref:Molecular chaperone TorD n=1 Tax=Bradyrhizobium canariense TaxID=255045 RepID=A0ABX3WXK3_9BRAD|nr:molecular chaperone TorD family protein [Bradyrhizobium canariense]OSJ08896.1 molecular chaperone TorD [Bradyrhizobium canariense]OSJ24291.1 molecular chaperone TorD [Bradyrhizobium canariense]